MDNAFDALMDEVCGTWGYCGCNKENQTLRVTLLIPPNGPVTADQFVEWVCLADDVNPNTQSLHIKTGLRAAFVNHMAAEVVDARLLRWSGLPVNEDEPGAY
jgi:hypothetical protein